MRLKWHARWKIITDISNCFNFVKQSRATIQSVSFHWRNDWTSNDEKFSII